MRTEIVALLSAIGLALASMVVYRITPEGRASGDTTGRGGSFVMGFWVRNWFYWFLNPSKAFFLRLNTSPFVFNALGIVFSIACTVFFARDLLPWAGAMILLSGIADVYDGEIARAQGVDSPMGAFLDSTLDRYAELFAFIGLAAFYGSGWPVVIVVTGLGGSLLVSYTRARGESLGVLCKLGVLQRAERMLLLGFGAILDPTVSAAMGRETGFLMLILLVIIAVGTMGTSIFRTIWISRRLIEMSPPR